MTREDKLVSTLELARDTFQKYGDLHRTKAPPQLEKARANYDMVYAINTALIGEDDQITLFGRVVVGIETVRVPDA